MSSSIVVKNLGADHRANSAASYAADRVRQASRVLKIRIRTLGFINTSKLSNYGYGPSLVASLSACKPGNQRFSRVVVTVAGFLAVIMGSATKAQVLPVKVTVNPAVEATLATKLSSPFRAAISDRPLRESLLAISQPLGINIWIDRKIDPTVPVGTGPEAKTVFEALSTLVDSAGAEIAVAENVVLVGRRDWALAVAGAVMGKSGNDMPRDLSWGEPSTPAQAMLVCGGSSSGPSLPHDLWAAVHWTAMRPSTARLLIVTQFDKVPSTTDPNQYVPLVAPAKIEALYPSGPHALTMRKDVLAVDQAALFREAKGGILLTSSPAGHHAATKAWLSAVRLQATKPLDIDKTRFSMRLENVTADQVFRQLATTSTRVLVIEPAAGDACKSLVSLAVQDKSLRDISEQVARSAGVTIQWSEQELHVKPLQ